mgnify:CR=1 FL=1
MLARLPTKRLLLGAAIAVALALAFAAVALLGISVSNVGTKLGRIRAQLRVTLARAGRTKEQGDSHATR